MGCTGLPVLKTGWATGPVPLPWDAHPTNAAETLGCCHRDRTGIALTQLSHGAGCACKLPANLLSQALASRPSAPAPDALLVGNGDLDDAAVWQIDERTALVQTVDFFTPIVDDPYLFGRIAATNAFSDVYAMGGTPALALNIVAFPKSLDPGILAEILRGGADVAAEAGAVVAGGHSIDDPEPKYGMVVTGFVDPRESVDERGARPGDALVLGKPIGTGVVTTALKHGVVCRSPRPRPSPR